MRANVLVLVTLGLFLTASASTADAAAFQLKGRKAKEAAGVILKKVQRRPKARRAAANPAKRRAQGAPRRGDQVEVTAGAQRESGLWPKGASVVSAVRARYPGLAGEISFTPQSGETVGLDDAAWDAGESVLRAEMPYTVTTASGKVTRSWVVFTKPFDGGRWTVADVLDPAGAEKPTPEDFF